MTCGNGSAAIRVLLADDHAPFREALRLDLEDAGFDVCAEACDGPGAVKAALRERPDVCLLDLRMPGGGSGAVADVLARVPSTKVIVLTVSRDADDVSAAVRAGAAAFLLKDVAADALAAALREVAAG